MTNAQTIDPKTDSSTHSSRFWFWKWILLSAAGAIIATILDSLLLQRRYYFFTGGFLSTIYTKDVGEVILFILTALLSDASVIVFLSVLVYYFPLLRR